VLACAAQALDADRRRGVDHAFPPMRSARQNINGACHARSLGRRVTVA
jgi:hypothetical protein